MDEREGRVIIDALAEAIGKLTGKKPLVRVERPAQSAGGPASAEEEARLKKATKRDIPTEPSADAFEDAAMERMYQAFKNRIIKESAIDPVLLQLLIVRPEIELEVERRVTSMDTSKPKGRIARLISQGWFDQEPRGSGQVRSELVRTGSDPGNASVGTALADLTREGFLERSGERYVKAPGVKISEKELAVTR